jgi:hypothetical protein
MYSINHRYERTSVLAFYVLYVGQVRHQTPVPTATWQLSIVSMSKSGVDVNTYLNEIIFYLEIDQLKFF